MLFSCYHVDKHMTMQKYRKSSERWTCLHTFLWFYFSCDRITDQMRLVSDFFPSCYYLGLRYFILRRDNLGEWDSLCMNETVFAVLSPWCYYLLWCKEEMQWSVYSSVLIFDSLRIFCAWCYLVSFEDELDMVSRLHLFLILFFVIIFEKKKIVMITMSNEVGYFPPLIWSSFIWGRIGCSTPFTFIWFITIKWDGQCIFPM